MGKHLNRERTGIPPPGSSSENLPQLRHLDPSTQGGTENIACCFLWKEGGEAATRPMLGAEEGREAGKHRFSPPPSNGLEAGSGRQVNL